MVPLTLCQLNVRDLNATLRWKSIKSRSPGKASWSQRMGRGSGSSQPVDTNLVQCPRVPGIGQLNLNPIYIGLTTLCGHWDTVWDLVTSDKEESKTPQGRNPRFSISMTTEQTKQPRKRTVSWIKRISFLGEWQRFLLSALWSLLTECQVLRNISLRPFRYGY